MRPITIKLPPHLARLLDDLARQRGWSRSAVVREALESYHSQPRNTVTAVAGELVGSLAGPPDLSTASKHMRGFGE